ncbi:MAG: hypothetical protein Q8P33_00875, partial [bacterium]|nr:hypothetical protein [bacterium]
MTSTADRSLLLDWAFKAHSVLWNVRAEYSQKSSFGVAINAIFAGAALSVLYADRSLPSLQLFCLTMGLTVLIISSGFFIRTIWPTNLFFPLDPRAALLEARLEKVTLEKWSVNLLRAQINQNLRLIYQK